MYIYISKFNPWVGKMPWRREWLPIPVFLPGEFQGQRRLVGYNPWGHKELDTIEQLTLKFFCDGLFYFSLLTVYSSASEFLSGYFLGFMSLCSNSHLVCVLFS